MFLYFVLFIENNYIQFVLWFITEIFLLFVSKKIKLIRVTINVEIDFLEAIQC